MGKVSDLSREWDRALGVTRSFSAASLQFAVQAAQLRNAETEDAAVHAAELEAKDKRIAELEAELAKRELPPLPESVREQVERMRDRSHHLRAEQLEFVAWIDTYWPNPVPQWELDAQMVEKGGVLPLSEALAIAARIREAGRGNSK